MEKSGVARIKKRLVERKKKRKEQRAKVLKEWLLIDRIIYQSQTVLE